MLNTFGGGILYLKVPEPIKKIEIKSRTKSKDFEASVHFKSKLRRPENIKYNSQTGVKETAKWNVELIFPNYFEYPKGLQKALLLIIGRKVKRICEYGRTNFAYMNIENEFEIKLLIDNKVESRLKVVIN